MPGRPTVRTQFAVALVLLLLVLLSGLSAAQAPVRNASGPDTGSNSTGAHAPTLLDPTAVAGEKLHAAQQSLADGLGPAQPSPHPDGRLALASCWIPLPCASPRGTGDSPASVQSGWHKLGTTEERFGTSLCYDPSDGYIVSFGGAFDPGSTWKYANGTWTNLTGSLLASPPARELGAMTYVPTLGEVVLFGGDLASTPNITVANDSWAFHAGAWTQIGASLGPAPPPRYGAGFAYDANDSAAVLFGGFNRTGAAVNGTWELVAGHWTNVTSNQTSSPSSVSFPTMAADAGSGGVVLLAGGVSARSYPNQTWTFTANRWTNLTSVVVGTPGPRADAGITTDTTDGGAVLFGGYLPPPNGTLLHGEPRDAWRFHNGTWARLSTGGSGPSARLLPALADDPRGGGVFLFGGYDEFNQTPFNDSWTLASGSWAIDANARSPTPRLSPMMAYDTATDSVILFGGSGLNDTWSYAHGAWTLLHPSRTPPGRVAGVLLDDPLDHELVLFGGEAITGSALVVTYFNDTWAWANGTWTNLTASAGGPRGVVAASAAYDSTSQQVVLFGGAARTSDFNATWSFHAGRWSNA
ncbi:MAG: kelch repeat-containing protein, partial [Thermoplasmata archaeon]|nr:kelch repeat-containing protein [Thermoplasmata archaeon]